MEALTLDLSVLNHPFKTMTLTTDEAAHFFSLTHQLDAFALNRSGLFARRVTPDNLRQVDAEKHLQVRDATFAGPEIIDAFIRENPDGLDADDLAVVEGWKRAVAGDFFIERHLAHYSIFIHDEVVYAVAGLYQPIREVVPYDLPIMVKAILLPYKGRIVYDGLLQTYPVSFGAGYRSSLKEAYLAAKQKRKIIESLDTTAPKPRPVTARDWRPEVEAMLKDAKKLRAGKDAPILQGPAFALVRASLELALAVAGTTTDTSVVYAAGQKVVKEINRINKMIDRGLPEE